MVLDDLVQARHLTLPPLYSQISSLLLDPTSLSLALMHTDSSFSLYPSLPPPHTLSSLPPPQTLISSPTSSATFLRLQTTATTSRLLFLVSSPSPGAAAVLLRFYILHNNQFTRPPRIICNQRDLKFDQGGVVFGVNHGASVKLIGSINVFAMYSVSNRKVWVFAVKMMDKDKDKDEDDENIIKVMRCAVIECCVPVFSVSVAFGFLILGEENGVRVFELRPLIKGKFEKNRRVLPNGKKKPQLPYNGQHFDRKSSNKISDSAKLRSVKIIQDSKEGGGRYVSFKKEVENFDSTKVPSKSVKSISIQALSPTKFLIMDSVGDVHLLRLSNPVIGSEIVCDMNQLPLSMKAQKLAVLPDISSSEHTFWISDGQYTVHVVATSDLDTSVGGSDGKDDDEKLMKTSVTSAIFASEKIQDLIPLATNSILILGQGSMFAYTFS